MIIRFLTSRFSRSLIFLVLLATIPAMLGGIWFLSGKAETHLRSAALEKLDSTANTLASRVDAWIGDAASDLQILSRHPDLISMDPARQRACLKEFCRIYSRISFAHVIGPDGINVSRSDDKAPIDYHDRTYFQRIMSGEPYARETIFRARSTNHPAVTQAAPICDPEGKILGVAVVGIDLHILSDVVGAARYGQTGYSCVVDEQGRSLAHPDLQNDTVLKDMRALVPVESVIRERKSGSYRFEDDRGVWWLAHTVPLKTGWSVISFQQEAEVLAGVRQMLHVTVSIMGIVALSMIGMTWIITRWMVRPIVSMTGAAIEIANGNWKQRIPEERRDELGLLARAFNKVLAELETMNRSLDDKVQELSKLLADGAEADEEIAKLSLAVQQSPVAVVITDTGGTIEYVNPRFTQMTGYTTEEAIGENPRILKSEQHTSGFYRNMWETLAAGREWRGELCNRKKDGSLFWELASISPIRNAGGEITNYMAVKEDVTERKNTEEQLTVFRRFAEASGQGLSMADLEGRLTYANPTLLHLFGTDNLQTILGKNIFSFIAGNRWDMLQHDFYSHLICEGRWVGETAIQSAEGKFLPIIADTFVIRDEKRQPLCLAAVITDITERKATEEALRKKEEELRQSQKLEAVGTLAGGIAHEFNNLLQAIRAFTMFAMKSLPSDAKSMGDLQEVLKASDRAVGLTRQLLSFSRRQQFQPVDMQLNAVLLDLETMLRPLIGETIELRMMLDDRIAPLHVDPNMIQQVVMNLCINARDAMPQGGILTIETEDVLLEANGEKSRADRRSGRYVRLKVSDTGTGMTPEVMEHIFEPFFTTKPVGQGTGLGLPMVYGAVKQHCGTVRVSSRLGEGTTFEIELPTVESANETIAAATADSITPGSETILLAEDDPLVRATLVRVLKEAGYNVIPSQDGAEAVKIFSETAESIELVILDMVMPRMGGFEAHRQITEINPDIPVVYCTGYNSDLADLDPQESSGLFIVHKPVDADELLAVIGKALERKSSCLTE